MQLPEHALGQRGNGGTSNLDVTFESLDKSEIINHGMKTGARNSSGKAWSTGGYKHLVIVLI